MAFEDTKKRKAPETLLEFSDYILPFSTKKQKTWHSESPTDADGTIIPPFYTVGELMGFNFDFPELPLDEESPSGSSFEEDASIGGEDGFPSVDSPDASAVKKRKKGRPVKYQVYPSDFDITLVLQDARFLDDDNSCPNKTIIRAIKYTMDNKAILQRNVSSLIGVSPSTLSLYMNETNRQNGWRTFEQRALTWLRKVWDVRPIEQVRSFVSQFGPETKSKSTLRREGFWYARELRYYNFKAKCRWDQIKNRQFANGQSRNLARWIQKTLNTDG